MAIDPELLRQALRSWATGVTVVTSRVGDQVHGMTVSSFTSVSLTPPLVLVSLQMDTRTHGMVAESDVFAVTILCEGQQGISNRFADPYTDTDYRFAGVETYTLVTGAPLIGGGLAHFDCKVIHVQPAATHTIFIGEVVAVNILNDETPLIYFNRGYHTLGEIPL